MVDRAASQISNLEAEITSPEEFRKRAERESWEEPRIVTLPESGARLKVRRPRAFYWKLRRTTWPRELVDKLDAQLNGSQAELTPEETLRLVGEQARMVRAAVIDPPVKLEAGPGQFDTDWLSPADGRFLGEYLRGRIDEHGRPVSDPSVAASESASPGPTPMNSAWRN
jgi:hypothetical protein